VNGLDDVGSGKGKQIVVAPKILVKFGELPAPEIGFCELVALDHGTHGPVNDQNALLKQFPKDLGGIFHVLYYDCCYRHEAVCPVVPGSPKINPIFAEIKRNPDL
jgi:hypothetical protein